MNLAFHASDRGSNPSLATIFYFFIFFLLLLFLFLSFIFLSFFIFNRIDNPPTSAFRYKFPKGSKYFVLFTEIQPFLEFTLTIMQTSPCNEYPLTPNFYIVKLVFTGVYIFFLIFALQYRSWVLVRFQRVPTIYVLSKIKKYLTFFHMKITIFTAVKYCSILHGHVCVMRSIFDTTDEVFMQQNFLQGIY